MGDRQAHLMEAWRMLAPHCLQRRLSSIYETQPMYVEDQPVFLNAVGMAAVSLEPRELLDLIHDIERKLGRNRAREQRMGPRTIDIDILLFDSLVVETPDLSIPHPRITERGFVLVPLLELSPDLHDPRTGVAYRDSLRGLGGAKPGVLGVYSPPSE